MTSVCPIIRTTNLNSPGGNELWDPLQSLDFGKNISLVIDMAFMGPCVLDHVVFVFAVNMPAQGSLAMNQEVEKYLIYNVVCHGFDLDHGGGP